MTQRTFTEEEIQDLTNEVLLLRDHVENGRINFSEHLINDFQRSYGAIKLRPDGKVDPSTVDARIRAAILMIRSTAQRDEIKKAISLSDIQSAYFKILFGNLGWLYERMEKAGAVPIQVAWGLSRDSKFLKEFRNNFPDFSAHLKEFWQQVGVAGSYHVQDGQQLKATFAGDLFPLYSENAVSTAGLYLDTIVLPCPVMRIAPLFGVMPDAEVAKLFIKHALTAMSYREVAMADITPPIALILPSGDETNHEERNQLLERAKPASLKHGAYLFGRDFESMEHLGEFCNSLQSVDMVMAELKGPERLLFDSKWDRDARTQLTRAMKEHTAIIEGFDESIAGAHVYGTCLGRLPQALGALENANQYDGVPLINAETSWSYYQWLLEYNSIEDPRSDEEKKGLHVARALTSQSESNLDWLGKVPPATVVEIRRNGLADELRGILSHGIADLIALRPDNYHRTADQVVANLDAAFLKHKQALREARDKKLKLYGFDVGSFVATGAIAVTAAITSNPTLGAISGLLGIAGLPNFKDIKTRFQVLADEERARKLTPAGLLFKHL